STGRRQRERRLLSGFAAEVTELAQAALEIRGQLGRRGATRAPFEAGDQGREQALLREHVFAAFAAEIAPFAGVDQEIVEHRRRLGAGLAGLDELVAATAQRAKDDVAAIPARQRGPRLERVAAHEGNEVTTVAALAAGAAAAAAADAEQAAKRR